MKQTRVHFGEDDWKALETNARQLGCTIPELVRIAVRDKFPGYPSKRKEALLGAAGIWKDLTDLPETPVYLRGLSGWTNDPAQ